MKNDIGLNKHRPEFVKLFSELVKDMSPEKIAEMVWSYGEAKWLKGYEQGTTDPCFELDD